MEETMKRIVYVLLILLTFSFNLNAQNLRVELNELSKDLSTYKIIDSRVNSEYIDGHIKSALSFPSSLTYEHESIDGKITEPTKMQNIIKELGLNVDDKIVIYGDGSFFPASRLFWALEVYGFKNVKLLNASYLDWKDNDFPISKEVPKVEKSNYIVSIDNQKLATKFITQIATKSKSEIVVDARSYKSYIGEESAAKRFGHIPKAINLPASDNIKNDGFVSRLKDINELKEIYKDLDKNKKIVLYCSIGKIASTNYFALRELGYDVTNYDASWKEWGNDFNLPIIEPSKK